MSNREAFYLVTRRDRWLDNDRTERARVEVTGPDDVPFDTREIVWQLLNFAEESRLVLEAVIGELGPVETPEKYALRRLLSHAEKLSETKFEDAE